MILDIVILLVCMVLVAATCVSVSYKNGYTHGYYDGLWQKSVDDRARFNLKDEDIMKTFER
jgi:hypothetical protein